jgi:uncharacterized protein (TIGR03084 family)
MVTEPTALASVLRDLEAEHQALDALVADLDEPSWDLPTPAAGWAVRDQVSHLAFFDDTAAMAMTEPERFSTMAEKVIAAGGDPMEEHLRRGRALAGADVLAWWRTARHDMVTAAGALSPRDRVPWFGPPMGALSFVSARLMETWAHGEDVAEALGTTRQPTARLRHIAHLGVRTRGFSYVVRGLDPPGGVVGVVLTGPAGERWAWDADGDPPDLVEGPALDFCLVVTQRRHVSDTALRVRGPAATRWMELAQAFAGAPGPGRAPRSGD